MDHPVVKLLTGLMSIVSTSELEYEIGVFLENHLVSLGYTVERIPISKGSSRHNIYAYLGASRKTRVLLTAHMDTVSRYKKEQFVRHSPVFVASSKFAVSAGVSSKEADKLLREATKEISAKKRAEWMSIGFFEQGILLGLGVYGVPILTCLGASIFFGVRLGIRKWASS
jgi:hypothetical protein